MSRITKISNQGSERTRLLKAIAYTAQQLIEQVNLDDNSRDIVAYIILSLDRLIEGINETITAWERRDYWIKVERFKASWIWVWRIRKLLFQALVTNNMPNIQAATRLLLAEITEVTPHRRPSIPRPWLGAWKILNSKTPKLDEPGS
jgi:predicted GNAT family acetyltransferase